MHIPSFRMPTIKQLWQLIQKVDYAFSIDLKNAYLHIPIFKCHCHFCDLFGRINFISGRFCHFGLLQPLGSSLPYLKHLVPLPSQGFSHFVYLDDVLVMVCSKHNSKNAQSFLCSLLVHFRLQINFSKSELHLTQHFCF